MHIQCQMNFREGWQCSEVVFDRCLELPGLGKLSKNFSEQRKYQHKFWRAESRSTCQKSTFTTHRSRNSYWKLICEVESSVRAERVVFCSQNFTFVQDTSPWTLMIGMDGLHSEKVPDKVETNKTFEIAKKPSYSSEVCSFPVVVKVFRRSSDALSRRSREVLKSWESKLIWLQKL